MKAVFIDGHSNGYTPKQCGDTLTVGELMQALCEYEDDIPVYIRHDNGYSYGSVLDEFINLSESDDG